MNKIVNIIVLAFSIILPLTTGSTLALAEATATPAAGSIAETVAHIEKAITEVNKSDFSAAYLHIKAARALAPQITGDEAILKAANEALVQGQIQANSGNPKKSAELLTKSLELYKSL